MAQTTPIEALDKEARKYSRHIRDRLPDLESTYLRALRKAGFDAQSSAVLVRTTPFAAARSLLKRPSLASFWRDVNNAGRELARMNIAPEQVVAALHIADSLAGESRSSAESQAAGQQMKFSTILVLNEAYHNVREAEHRALQRLLDIEVEASSTDVLLRGMLEVIADACEADAAHAFLLAGEKEFWQIRASTAHAATPKTSALVAASFQAKRALAKPRRITNPAHILDAGWSGRYAVVWSVPLRDSGVLQVAFKKDRDLLPRDLEMLVSAGERCYVATAKTRMLEEIVQREDRLSKLAIRMLMVEENERRRISRELHDDAGQSLVVIRLQMELIEQLLPPNSEERERLAEARDITEKAILDIRRLIADLSPAVLEQLGLGAGLRQLINRFRNRYPCRVDLDVGQLPNLDSKFQLVIYRLTQECLNNISEHSKATTVNISVSTADRVLRLHVEDNGTGFDVEQTLESKGAYGLIGIRERVAVLGGTVEFNSTRKEGHPTSKRKKTGTIVRIELPIR